MAACCFSTPGHRQRVVPLQATGQLTLTFEVGTVERHQSAMDVVRRVAYELVQQ